MDTQRILGENPHPRHPTRYKLIAAASLPADEVTLMLHGHRINDGMFTKT